MVEPSSARAPKAAMPARALRSMRDRAMRVALAGRLAGVTVATVEVRYIAMRSIWWIAIALAGCDDGAPAATSPSAAPRSFPFPP
jgi:hypothetical protein